MTRTIVDIDILHTVPPSNLNRDDTGRPKTARYGGVERSRVSSQSWKRATRLAFNERLDPSEVGVRSVRIVELVADRIQAMRPDCAEESALSLASTVVKEAGIKLTAPRAKKDAPPQPEVTSFLYFLSAAQLDALARIAVAAADDDNPETAIKAAKPKNSLDLQHSIDIALFGRMVADQTDLNVDAAAQVAHAISVHAVENEYDYYTAVDDYKMEQSDEDAGAGMIGVVEFNSATLYRYATIDVDALHANLDGNAEVTRRAVEEFVSAFSTSIPSGKQNSFAHGTPADAIVVSIRERQSVNRVGAFENPIASDFVQTAARELATHAKHVDEKFDTTPVASWAVSINPRAAAVEELGDAVSINGLISQLGATVAERLTANA